MLSHHLSSHTHGLQSMRLHVAPSVWFKVGSNDIVDGDVEGAKLGLRRLFRYLMVEMFEKST